MSPPTCPRCGRPASPGEAYCPACGTLLRPPDPQGPPEPLTSVPPAGVPLPGGTGSNWKDLPDPFGASPEVIFQWDRTLAPLGGVQVVDTGGNRLAQFRHAGTGLRAMLLGFVLESANGSPIVELRPSKTGKLVSVNPPSDVVAPWGAIVAQIGRSAGFSETCWIRREGEEDISASVALSPFSKGFPLVQKDLLIATVTLPRARPKDPAAPWGLSLRFDAPYLPSLSRPLLVALVAEVCMGAPRTLF